MSDRRRDEADQGIAIHDNGRRVLLKWHKLRRAATEPPFPIANLPAGLALGASMEIDVRQMADGYWICLHDELLDDETDGSGPVGRLDATSSRRLRISGGDYPPPLLTDITAAIADTPNSAACVQLDLKEPAATLTEAGIARFAEAIAPVADRCLLSGTEFEAVSRLASGITDLRIGFDPYDLAEGRDLRTRAGMEAMIEETFAIAPNADAFYLYHRFVSAALSLDFNPLLRLKENGALIDVWTLDPGMPGVRDSLALAIAAGADQITTNDPPGLARLWTDG